MSIEKIADLDLEKTGFAHTLGLIGGKYKIMILYCLVEAGIIRYNELKRCIKKISHKTLSATLKELEADGLVHRKEYHQIPPKVEYSLTELGKSVMPVIDSMCCWGEEHMTQHRAKTNGCDIQ